MKKRILYLDEIDRACPSAAEAMMQELVDIKLPKGGWLRHMWWRLTGRGPRYYLISGNREVKRDEEQS